MPRILPRGERSTEWEPVPTVSLVLLTATTVLISVASTYTLLMCGPAIMAVGLAVTGLFQWADAGPLTVGVWFAGLILAGVGIGIAFPHPAGRRDGQFARQGLGAPEMAHSARYPLFGFAAIALFGCLTARRS